jgi:hypothetical protein
LVVAASVVAYALDVVLQDMKWGHVTTRFAMSSMVVAYDMIAMSSKKFSDGSVPSRVFTQAMNDSDDGFLCILVNRTRGLPLLRKERMLIRGLK